MYIAVTFNQDTEHASLGKSMRRYYFGKWVNISTNCVDSETISDKLLQNILYDKLLCDWLTDCDLCDWLTNH
jgi:hypothetical protein